MTRWPVLTLFCALFGCASYDDPAERIGPGLEPAEPATASASFETRDVVLSTEPWTFGETTGSVIRTQHYRIFTTSDRAIITDTVPGFLEASLSQYRTALAPLPEPPVKLDTYLMHTRPEWAALTRALMRDRADLYLRIERGGFAASGRGVYRDLGTLSDTLNLAAHEGWHQYTQLTFKSRLPIYLEEGIATYMEGFKFDPARPGQPIFLPWANTQRYDALRQAAADDTLMTLEELTSTSPQELIVNSPARALTWYAQVWALVHFLIEGESAEHADVFEAMLITTAAGEPRRPARQRISRQPLSATIGLPMEELEQQYARFIERIVAPGARDRIVAGYSPVP